MENSNEVMWYNQHNLFEIPADFCFDIQRFASAEAEGRSEKATEHKRRKAREEGRVALSKEIPAVIITLLSFLTIYFLAKYIFETMYVTFRYTFENIATLDLTMEDVFFKLFLTPFLKIFIPIAIAAFIAALLSNYLQIGVKFSVKAIKPNFKKVNPNVFKFLANQVFSVSGFFNFLKSIVKIVIIGAVAFFTITGKLEEIRNILFVDNIFYSFLFIIKIIFSLVVKTILILLVFSIVDLLFVRWQFEEQLKMTKQEIKEEHKELYGDPKVKAKLKQMYQTIMSEKKMLDEVPKADVVITNPTHYAVALHYDKNVDEAPRVIAKGKDAFAQKIKETARQHRVYIHENVALARTLYNDVEINDIIPRAMFGLVINAYKFAMRAKERAGVA